jgi:predicted dehydrogenase
MAGRSESVPVTRRRLLGAAAVGAAAPYVIRSGVLAAPGEVGANEKINVGLIGANGQGNWNLTQLLEQPDVAVTAVCEVDQGRREAALAKCNGNAKGYTDYRDVLARNDIDAVLIATSPHWHALMSIHAAEAGKDFYCEKPMTLHLAESLAVKRAAEKHGRVTQVGTQIHAKPNYRRIVDVVRSGVLGPISTVRTFHVLNQGPEGIGTAPDTEPPEGLDWNMWLGPAEKRKFNALLFRDSYHHPSFMISGGWTPGMAPHIIDLPFWALELDCPLNTSSFGGRYVIKDSGDAYDFQQAQWQFPNFTLTWWTSLTNCFAYDQVLQGGPGLHRNRGQFYHGLNGTLIGDYGYLKVLPEGDRMGKEFKVESVPKIIPTSPGHHREWLDGIRSRKQPSCHVGYHYKLDVALNLAMLSMKLGRSIRFDPKTERIIGDTEAQKLSVPQYRAPWKFPEEYVAEL